MPVISSRTIDISERNEVGRNDPCPCGSGKKYKKCCLAKEQFYKPEDKKGLISRILDWTATREDLAILIVKIIEELYGKKIDETQMVTAEELALFEREIKGKTLLEHFVQDGNLNAADKEIYTRWLEMSRFSFFEVIGIDLGKSMKARDLFDRREFLVWERMGTYGLETGDVLIARVVPHKEDWMFTGGYLGRYHGAGATEMKKLTANFKFSNGISEWDFACSQRDSGPGQNDTL